VRVVRLGPALTLAAGVDPLLLGSGVHAFLAADVPSLDEDDRRELAARLLDAWSLAEAMSVEDLLAAGRRFSQWLATRWPGGRARCEWPVTHRLPEGTVVHGKIDVLVETEGTLAVIDHKIIAAPEARALTEAAGYAGQLRLYADALRAATGRASLELLVHLPLAGLVAEIT
jgi:ATP-dependent exoDNAse (exonuclease V) beta subunit